MSGYLDTAHSRVNKFVSALRVTMPSADVISHLAGAFPLHLADLEAVVREWAEQRDRIAAQDVIIDGLRHEVDDYAKHLRDINAGLYPQNGGGTSNG